MRKGGSGLLWGLFILLFLWAAQAAAAERADGDLEIGRMRVAVWPEYDSTGVLFIYDGRFKDPGVFPAETVFLLPPGSVLSDVCSLSPKGQHFCQLYRQKRLGDHDEVSVKLPYPNFYLSFHTEPFGEEGELRRLDHVIKINHRVDELEVDVQSPLRAEDFTVVEPPGLEVSTRRGFDHYSRVFSGLEPGDELRVSLRYTKKDRRPSVDIKYSPMRSMEKMSDTPPPYEVKRIAGRVVYMAAGLGLIVLAGLGYLLLKGGKGHG